MVDGELTSKAASGLLIIIHCTLPGESQMRLTRRNHRATLGLALGSALCVGTGAAIVTAGNSTKIQPSSMMETISPETRDAIHSANHLSTAFRTVADHVLPSVVAIENRPTMAKSSSRTSWIPPTPIVEG